MLFSSIKHPPQEIRGRNPSGTWTSVYCPGPSFHPHGTACGPACRVQSRWSRHASSTHQTPKEKRATLPPVNPQDLDIAVQTAEEHPDRRKIEHCKEIARDLLAVGRIRADTYSAILARLKQIQEK